MTSGPPPRLSPATLALLPAAIARPRHARTAPAARIVHLGVGAFHRAHQAVYTDSAMHLGDADWAITGVSLRSADVAAMLHPQQGLYCVVERSNSGEQARLIGALREVIVARERREATVAVLADPETQVVTLTVTEKGYCRNATGTLDARLADATSIFGLLGDALERRRVGSLPGLTLLSCDNLAENGRQLRSLMHEYLERHSPPTAAWFARECRCPATMVDRIVPATTDRDRDDFAARHGVRDEALVITEPFTQWVIEDDFAGPRPRWELAGAQLTRDVRAHEAAKLRMLNGAHSALAYLGLARGHEFVHQAVADPVLAPLVHQIMDVEAAGSLAPSADLDLAAYSQALLQRFANAALRHRLLQIAMDGSQKIPQRWLETLAAHQAQGRCCPALLTALAAWLRHVRGDVHAVDDPLAAPLARAWHEHGTTGIVDAVLGNGALLATRWRPTAEDRAFLLDALQRAQRPLPPGA